MPWSDSQPLWISACPERSKPGCAISQYYIAEIASQAYADWNPPPKRVVDAQVLGIKSPAFAGLLDH